MSAELIKLYLNRGNTANHCVLSRMARRRKPAKKRRGKGSTDSSCSIHNSVSSDHMEMDNSLLASEDVDSLNCTVIQLDDEGELRRNGMGSQAVEEGDEDEVVGLLRLPEMTDTSMDSVGQPLRDVMDRLNGALDREEAWEHPEEEEEKTSEVCNQSPQPPAQQPFREDSGGEPPDPAPGETSRSPLSRGPKFQQASPTPTDLRCFTPNSPDSASTGGGHYDSTEHSQSQTLSGGLEDEGEAKAQAGQEPDMKEEVDVQGEDTDKNTCTEETQQQLQEEKLSPSESSHPAEFKYEVSSK